MADTPVTPSPVPREYEVEPLDVAGDFQGVVLSSDDPVEAAMGDLIRVYRFRRAGLTVEGDVFATFSHSARGMDLQSFGAPEALLFLVQIEQSKINAMRKQGTLFDPTNRDALNAYLEMTFYSFLLYAWIKGYMRQDL